MKYEYKMVWNVSVDMLNELGAKGWELKGVVSESGHAPKLIFMRPLPLVEVPTNG